MRYKGFPGSKELTRCRAEIDQTWSNPITQETYQYMCQRLDTISRVGNQQTRQAVANLKQYAQQYVEGKVIPTSTSGPKVVIKEGVKITYSAARNIGDCFLALFMPVIRITICIVFSATKIG